MLHLADHTLYNLRLSFSEVEPGIWTRHTRSPRASLFPPTTSLRGAAFQQDLSIIKDNGLTWCNRSLLGMKPTLASSPLRCTVTPGQVDDNEISLYK